MSTVSRRNYVTSAISSHFIWLIGARRPGDATDVGLAPRPLCVATPRVRASLRPTLRASCGFGSCARGRARPRAPRSEAHGALHARRRASVRRAVAVTLLPRSAKLQARTAAEDQRRKSPTHRAIQIRTQASINRNLLGLGRHNLQRVLRTFTAANDATGEFRPLMSTRVGAS
jgi:hypothetical protein